NGPTGAVNVGLVDGKFIINPKAEDREKSEINLTVSGTKDAIMMVEAGANEVSEKTMLEAILTAHEEIKNICDFINEIVKECGKEKAEFKLFEPNPEIAHEIREFGTDKLIAAINTVEKQEREDKIAEVSEEITQIFLEKYPESEQDI